MKAYISNCEMFLLNCGINEIEIQTVTGRAKISFETNVTKLISKYVRCLKCDTYFKVCQ